MHDATIIDHTKMPHVNEEKIILLNQILINQRWHIVSVAAIACPRGDARDALRVRPALAHRAADSLAHGFTGNTLNLAQSLQP
jgi:hypothetical protein